MDVIDVRGDGRFSGHGPLRRRARFDRVELAKQAGITSVEQIRLLAWRAIENLRQHVGQSTLEDCVGGRHRFPSLENVYRLVRLTSRGDRRERLQAQAWRGWRSGDGVR